MAANSARGRAPPAGGLRGGGAMQLSELCSKLTFDHLPAKLDTLCEQAAKRELNYRDFLAEVLGAEWHAQQPKPIPRAAAGCEETGRFATRGRQIPPPVVLR